MLDSLFESLALLDATFWLTAAAIFGLLLLSAFFSGSETALTAASRGKLRAQADKGSAGAATALAVKEDATGCSARSIYPIGPWPRS